MTEVVVFAVFALAAVAGAVTLVVARNPVHSAVGLLVTMFSVAVFYVLNGAHFVAVVQVLIYAGAVMTLFLFVIMLIGVDTSERREEPIPFQRPVVLVLGAGLLALVLLAGRAVWVIRGGNAGTAVGTIEDVSDRLFGTWMLPFQSTVLLLTIAAVGTIALARYTGRPRHVEFGGDDRDDTGGEDFDTEGEGR
ncbi:MAG: NADH-quinone oxidoreductase subunit J [Acidimicrobiia bacterium]|jgi:NADH-quinone oxidoreductase subunit J